MKNVGPELTALMHWLAECPADCYEIPLGPPTHKQPVALDITAIVSDHLRDLGIDLELVESYIAAIGELSANEQRLVVICSWLLREPWLMKNGDAVKIARLLSTGLAELASAVSPTKTVSDPDRREELVRICLRELGYRPEGETQQQSTDRLNTLDSAERIRVIRKTRAAESRARKIREAMAKKAAEEAAARYSPE